MVKLVGLKIDKLHGYFNYDVSFNSDINFLYGDNGCGKTTILNIITYIITGKIYELFQYNFKKIILEYSSDKTNNINSIIISYEEMENNIKVNLLGEKDEKEGLLKSQSYGYMNGNTDDKEDIERFYFSEYPVLKDIKDVFKYIYLPLNRNSNFINEYPFLLKRKSVTSKYRMSHEFDTTLLDVEYLIKNANNRVNFVLNQINENFSDDILKSFLDVENTSNIDLIIKYMNSLNNDEIEGIKQKYTQVLKTIKKWDEETEVKINAFFNSLTTDIDRAKKQNDVKIALLLKLSELTKISNIITKAEDTELNKKKHKQPIDDFVKTVNSFISGNVNKKEIFIDTIGTIYLRTSRNKRIDIQHLSSGEKQIVTFFAYLIFGLKNTNQSIFIVDEPELSLHLNWQRKFVDAIMSINSNVQLIFATHAPEIIGRHRDKAIKLIPEYEG